MALGIPAVCTPLGSNPDVVQHGRTGFLADSHDEWVDALEELVTNHDRRREMSAAAADEAHRRYTVQANADRIIQAFRDAVR
jgi:glycosyltransferase involved in cell wall biosynthesis